MGIPQINKELIRLLVKDAIKGVGLPDSKEVRKSCEEKGWGTQIGPYAFDWVWNDTFLDELSLLESLNLHRNLKKEIASTESRD